MKDELIALADRLNEMAINTGTLNCLGCGYEHGCGLHGCAALKRAADIIRCVSLNVMDDIKLALLGDREAARRLTDAGTLLPCPGCGGEHNRCWWQFGGRWVECDDCGWKGPTAAESDEARLAWNTRAPILSAEEMERLEATNEHDAQRVRG